MNPKPKKHFERFREIIRLKHYSQKTEQAYQNWIKQYILFHGKKTPTRYGLGRGGNISDLPQIALPAIEEKLS